MKQSYVLVQSNSNAEGITVKLLINTPLILKFHQFPTKIDQTNALLNKVLLFRILSVAIVSGYFFKYQAKFPNSKICPVWAKVATLWSWLFFLFPKP